ncbi:MAG: MBL fold metallo-hydrolase, partial [Variibacter sp.]|nr:MBL fold metallo-hydrolase [Variibacter sp.]
MLVTRRSALAGAATLASAAALGVVPSAKAAAPLAGKQAPGFYRYKLGSFEITVVTDGARSGPLPDGFVRNAAKDQVSAALRASFLAGDTLTIPFNPVVVNTGSKLVVIDTGLGPAAYQQSKGAMGQFHTNLAAAGIAAKDVDAVVITHFHGDHINGLLDPDNKLAFPNAEVLVPANEWKYWTDDGNMSKVAGNEGLTNNFKNVRRVFGAFGNKVTPYEGGKDVAPGIMTVSTPGHTPGHVSHIVSSGSATVMVQADVTNIPALFVANPNWHAVF